MEEYPEVFEYESKSSLFPWKGEVYNVDSLEKYKRDRQNGSLGYITAAEDPYFFTCFGKYLERYKICGKELVFEEKCPVNFSPSTVLVCNGYLVLEDLQKLEIYRVEKHELIYSGKSCLGNYDLVGIIEKDGKIILGLVDEGEKHVVKL